MTLPFRGRHHDAEAAHDRARALSSSRHVEALDPDDEAWLTHHLEGCTECRREQEAFAADRELLRSLRDTPVEPPRDLWARTAAELDQAAARRHPVASGSDRRSAVPRERGSSGPWLGMPVGAAAGVLILLVVVGTALLPGLFPPSEAPVGSQVALSSGSPGPTPIAVAAKPVVQGSTAADGSFEIRFTPIDDVCPRARPQCVPSPAGPVQTLGLLAAKQSTITISPADDQLVFEATRGTASEGKIFVLPVPATSSGQTPPPTATTGTGSQEPATPEPGSQEPTPAATPIGQVEIASGVTVVGEVAYSRDGHYLAFSAAPIDGSTGPDLYLWSAESGTAAPVTSDHQTYFSSWLGNQVLASRLAVLAAPEQPGSSTQPGNSTQPAASEGASQGNGPPIEVHPSSFLLDPATLVRTEVSQPDVWMPVVDESTRHVAYWSGTLRSKNGGWELGTGQLVLEAWSTGAETSAPGASDANEASAGPEASSVPVIGPIGQPTALVTGQVADFRAKFDPEGIRLAIWVGEQLGEPVGRLHLVVIDPSTGAISSAEPLPGAPALRRFSIDSNRLAWVSPPGQDGQESSLQVLGWDGDSFGEIHTEPAQDLLILR
jgi:hypothetical protein